MVKLNHYYCMCDDSLVISSLHWITAIFPKLRRWFASSTVTWRLSLTIMVNGIFQGFWMGISNHMLEFRSKNSWSTDDMLDGDLTINFRFHGDTPFTNPEKSSNHSWGIFQPCDYRRVFNGIFNWIWHLVFMRFFPDMGNIQEIQTTIET